MAKQYAVKMGRTPGIYDNFNDCLEQVKGYKNAQYKGFNTMEEAIVYMESDTIYQLSDCNIADIDKPNNIFTENTDSDASAYIDSYINYNNATFTSCLYFVNDDMKCKMVTEYNSYHPLSKLGADAGKILAAQTAMEMAKQHSVEHLTIYQKDNNRVDKYFTSGRKSGENIPDIKSYFKETQTKVNVYFSPKIAIQSNGFKAITEFSEVNQKQSGKSKNK